MGQAIITLKIMPESPETGLEAIRSAAEEKIDAFVGESGEKRSEEEPIAFGLTALKITFVMEESKGSTELLEKEIAAIEGVQSVDVVDVRRALG